MNKTQIAQVVKKAADGDAESFAKIYAQYEQRVYYFALRITKNESDASDVLQDTMLSLYKNLLSIQDVGKLSSYVMRIAYHCSLKVLKKAPAELAEDEVLERVPDDNSTYTPEIYVENKERHESLLKLLDRLNEGQRAVITLFYYENFSVKQIAEILEVSESVVKTRLSRGRTSLRQMLAQKKGMVTSLLAILLLPHLLRSNAKAAYGPSVQSANWDALCKRMDFPAKLAESRPRPLGWPRPLGGVRAVPVITGGAGAVALAATALVLFTQGAEALPQPVAAAPSSQAEVVVDRDFELSSEPEDVIIEDLFYGVPEEDGALDPEWHYPDIYSVDGGQFVRNEAAAQDRSRPQSSGRTDRGSFGGGGKEAGSAADTQVGEEVFFAAPNFLITCRQGVVLSEEEILAKAGANLARPAEIRIAYYSQVDFYTPGEYGLYLQARDEEGTVSPRLGVIVLVEGESQ